MPNGNIPDDLNGEIPEKPEFDTSSERENKPEANQKNPNEGPTPPSINNQGDMQKNTELGKTNKEFTINGISNLFSGITIYNAE